ncbi:resuscitation-promoting factor [Alkalibacterium psychrotolerans]
MLIQKNRLVKAGVTLSAAALFLLANDSEASASQFTSANWEPRTVSEIENEISAQNNEKGVAKYTFQWGDTLWGISQATDISVDKLVQVNDIDNRSLIHVGSTIFLSKDASVISVQNGEEEVVSYDVSTDEVTETETPEEVEESANEEAEVEASQPVEETVVEEQPVEEPVEEVVEEEPAEEAETVVEEQPAEAASEPVEETQATEATQASESRSGRWMTVEATAYSRNQEVLSNFTFTGIDLRENSRVIAVDPDVIPLGSTVYVPGYGEYVAGDTGGAIIGNRVDLHMESVADAFEFGRRTLDIQIVE